MKRIIIILIIIIGSYLFVNKYVIKKPNKEELMIDLSNHSLIEIKDYAQHNNLKLEIEEEYNNDVDKDIVISQNIDVGTKIKKGDKLIVIISLGKVPIKLYRANNINELGMIPIIMYHGIIDLKNEGTNYTGGNIDKDGYNRTTEAFINDLEWYYQNGYRMIRLKDYIDGEIDTEFGKSPIILTFDDGRIDSIKIRGKDKNDNLIIDPTSAIGILETFKQKYPDFNITATFFINEGLFNQPLYNEEIIKWLIENGYDIGNHTKGHIDFTKVSEAETQEAIAYLYQKLESIIGKKYVNIIALPFGSPYQKTHPCFPFILEGEYNGYKYQTEATLRVGWDAELSPYHQSFDKTFLKRIRAWDNNGQEFDLEMCFKLLETKRYISDGDANTIVIKDDQELNLNLLKKVIKY